MPRRNTRIAGGSPSRTGIPLKQVIATANFRIPETAKRRNSNYMDEPRKFYLTTPIYYANSRPHVGSAYTTIVCDVIARYKRMCGYDVAYLTGTDEHGVNIERAAEKLGITPRSWWIATQKIFRELWKLLGIRYTHFMRTTSTEHAIAVQKLVRRTLRRTPDAIYKAKYEGRYCIYDNLYVSDSPEPADCPICGRPAELISEENYFFRLSALSGKAARSFTRISPISCSLISAERSEELRRGRTEGYFHQPQVDQVGHSLAGRSRARFLRVVRRADQLHERNRLCRGRPKGGAKFRNTGLPTCT